MSVRYDNVSDYIKATANLPTNTAYSIFGWCKFINAGAGTTRSMFAHRDTGFSIRHYLRFDSDNQLRVSANNGTNTATLTSPTLTTWFAWAFTNNGTGAGSAKGYVRQQGAGAWTSATTTGASFTANDIFIGMDSQSPDAEIRYCRMWNAVLSEAELTSEFNSATLVRTANILRHMALAAGASAGTDTSGNGYNMTAVNSGGGNLSNGASEPTFGAAIPILQHYYNQQ